MFILDLISPFYALLRRRLGQGRARRQEAERWVEDLLLAASLKEGACIGIRPDPTRRTVLVTLSAESYRGHTVRSDVDIPALDAACLKQVEHVFLERIRKSRKVLQRISKRNVRAFRGGFLQTIPGTVIHWEISIVMLSGMQTFFLRRV